jgi:hypothetical protein
VKCMTVARLACDGCAHMYVASNAPASAADRSGLVQPEVTLVLGAALLVCCARDVARFDQQWCCVLRKLCGGLLNV